MISCLMVNLFVHMIGCCWCCGNRIWENTSFWSADFATLVGGKRKGCEDVRREGRGSRKGRSKRPFTGPCYYSYKRTFTSGNIMSL